MEKEIKYHDIKTASSEEKRILDILECARKSEDLKRIIQDVKMLAQLSASITIYASRVKRSESFLRTVRVKGFENACDLAGVLFVVEENKEIYKISERLGSYFKNVEHYDLSKELGIPPYKTVPLCYTILTQLYLKDVDVTVPFEVRIHDKVGILATESNYYLYKKDGISNVKERFELSGKMLQVIRLRAEIDSLRNNGDDKKTINSALIRENLLNNKNFFLHYLSDIYNVFKEYARNLFRYNNKHKVGHFEFVEGNILTDEESNNLDQKLYSLFDLYYKQANVELSSDEIMNFYFRCDYAINKIKMLELPEFVNIFEQLDSQHCNGNPNHVERGYVYKK